MFRKIILASLLSSSFSYAQQITVEKVKGNKAVVEFSGVALSPGRTYAIGGSASEGAVGGSRTRIVGGSFDLQFYEYSSSTNGGDTAKDNMLSLIGRYGWNFETFEVGMLAGYLDTESPSSKFASVKFGLFGDYNLTPNRPGTMSIYGVGGEGSYTSITSSGGGSMMGVFAGVFAKWFVFGPSTALRVDAGYNYEKGNYTLYSTATQGFNIRGGISTYF
ncbi:hypothetical protein [Bdellovibrio sp. HCB337]|uniref:hypothetical protein n=1 Tax=Bdellovibrio sp. HCB337 TaxID=3394358 RepID=UPI0039A578D6